MPTTGDKLPYEIGPGGFLVPAYEGPERTFSPDAIADWHGDMVVPPHSYDPAHMVAMGPYDEDFGFPVMNVLNWGGGRKSFGYFPTCADCRPVIRAGRFVVPSDSVPAATGHAYVNVKALCWEHAKPYVGIAWPRPLIHLGVFSSQRELCFEPWPGFVSPTVMVRSQALLAGDCGCGHPKIEHVPGHGCFDSMCRCGLDAVAFSLGQTYAGPRR